jgi:uncharacterized repeat protein (TIGR01451 family)
VFVFDIEFNQINAFSPAGPVQNFAGVGSAEGFSGDGGPAVSAELDYPEGIAVDAEGNLFIADTGNHRIRKVDRNGIITTVAGDGTPGFTSEGTPLPNGDGGQATLARITYPGALAFDHAGNLFIAEGYKIRKVTPQGIITTVVGKGYGYDGDGGPAIDAKLGHIGGLAVDSENNLYIADSDNNRIRKVTFGPPKLTAVTPNVVYRGATLDVRLSGTGLAGPIAIDAGEAITVSNIRVVSDLSVVVTLAIGNAALGQRTVAITTGHGTSNAIPLTVVPESPDLSITSSIIEDFGVGFNGRYGFVIRNVGTRTTQGPITVTDKLPPGFTYVSGSGEGWSCAPAAGMVSCTNSGSLDVGASTELALTVAVPNNVSGCPTNEVTVEGTGDIISLNNASQTAACVTPAPAPVVQISSSNLSTGQQAMAQVTLSHAFPYDLTGELTVGFQAFAVPADDPALQFATGGRQISFVVPANTLQARFGDLQLTQVDFQAGTVAGTLTFTGILKVGTVEERHATTRVVPAIAPTIHKVETTGGDVILITLSSTVRNVMRLRVTFNTTSPVQLSCGSVAGCSVSGTTVTFDVKLLFDQWYRDDKVYGGLARLRVPFSIQGSVKGTVTLALQNIVGISAPAQLSLP